MNKKDLKIGLALSGGGMRAAIYHLGVLQSLAEEGLLGNITRISSVSGASLCMGLIYACNDRKWPTDTQYLQRVLPRIKELITQKDIQWTSLVRLLVSPYYWDKKVNLFSDVMEKKWGLCCCLQEIPDKPLWIINTTAYETGEDFRISPKRMGTKGSYVIRPQFRMSHAMGASAGFPILIGPYKLKTKKYEWRDKTDTISMTPQDRVLHLWDGGVYDNMGLDPIFKMREEDVRMSKDINYMIVSNASGNIEHQTRKHGYSITNLKRMLDINMDQVNVLKTQAVTQYMKKYHNGVYLKIGTMVKDIVRESDFSFREKEELIHDALNTEDVLFVKDYKTTLARVKLANFHKIMRHGYETCHTTLTCWGPKG